MAIAAKDCKLLAVDGRQNGALPYTPQVLGPASASRSALSIMAGEAGQTVLGRGGRGSLRAPRGTLADRGFYLTQTRLRRGRERTQVLWNNPTPGNVHVHSTAMAQAFSIEAVVTGASQHSTIAWFQSRKSPSKSRTSSTTARRSFDGG